MRRSERRTYRENCGLEEESASLGLNKNCYLEVMISKQKLAYFGHRRSAGVGLEKPMLVKWKKVEKGKEKLIQ